MSVKRQLELDTSKLTWEDWDIVQDFTEGRLKSRELRGTIARASGWTDEELKQLPSTSIIEAFKMLSESLGKETSQKN